MKVEALQHLTRERVLQPVLFHTEVSYYVKLDNTAVPIYEPSCFANCVDFLSLLPNIKLHYT